MGDARRFTAQEVDAAIATLEGPEAFAHAREVVEHAAPGLQRILDRALDEGGWFSDAHERQVDAAALEEDPLARSQAVRALLGEEVRLGMLVGVAVGFELRRRLEDGDA